VAGRAAGCSDYLDCLRSGVRVGKAVVTTLELGRCAGQRSGGVER
jgi:hypothetical protein